LADRGLPAALRSQARKAPLPVTVQSHKVGRYPPQTEAAVYFCVLEALQNVYRHAQASTVRVQLTSEDHTIRFKVVDNGCGFDHSAVAPGNGLPNMADRLDAIGGTLSVHSRPGMGSQVSGIVPFATG
jgi:signal transduction histidine kinase